MSTDFTTPEGYTTFVTMLASKDTMQNELTKMGTMGLGLGGEAGEIAQLVSDITADGVLSEGNRLKLIDELGDILWYVAFGAGNVVNVPFRQILPEYVTIRGVHNPMKSLEPSYTQLMFRCGKVADTVKKLLYHGKPYNEEARLRLVGMLADVLFAAETVARDVCGVHLSDSIKKNVEKLSERYKSLKFSTEEFMAKEEGKSV